MIWFSAMIVIGYMFQECYDKLDRVTAEKLELERENSEAVRDLQSQISALTAVRNELISKKVVSSNFSVSHHGPWFDNRLTFCWLLFLILI